MFKKTPLVSIITPVYNREQLISECIHSVQDQTYKDYEHIIIDDESTDDTIKNIESLALNDKRIIVIKSKENSEGKPGKVRNIGLKAAKGKYVAFLDSDDLWESNKLSAQVQFMLNESFDFSYHPLGRFKNNLKDQTSFWGRRSSQNDIFRDLFLKNFIPTSSVIAKKSVLEENALFDESLKYSEDYFLWLKIALKEYKIGFLSSVLGGFRRNRHGNINNILMEEEKNINDIAIKEKIIFDYRADSISRLAGDDLLYGYIFYYFNLAKNESDTKKRKTILHEAIDKISQLNISALFMKELDLLRNIRKI